MPTKEPNDFDRQGKRGSNQFYRGDPRLQQAVDAFDRVGSQKGAAEMLGIARHTLRKRLQRAKDFDVKPTGAIPIERDELPDGVADVDDILDRRRKEFDRTREAAHARKLINVKVKLDGPIGICHMGDPHVDDTGTNIRAIENHIGIINATEGLFGANVGDTQNNWVGRLAHLWGEESLTRQEAWRLTEWFVSTVQWLYILGGNHDVWSGAGDPLKWILRSQVGVYENWGARLNLIFPNGKEVRVNARHDFHGHSQWNPTHGPMKAVQMGWRDHILTCGHKHVSGFGILKCPASGLISRAIRVAGYKEFDKYASDLGLPDQNVSPACVTIISPDKADNDPGLVSTFWDVEEGADFLKYKRRKY